MGLQVRICELIKPGTKEGPYPFRKNYSSSRRMRLTKPAYAMMHGKKLSPAENRTSAVQPAYLYDISRVC
jgi:hypothetical protein